jgi:uncharacterized protein (DUF2336 family)
MVISAKQAITQLAALKDPSQRTALALGVTDLCVAQPLSATAEPVAGDILVTVASSLTAETKIEMAKKLATCKWAPNTAVRYFAFEDIGIAAIIIKNSSCLSEQDMLDLAAEGSHDHRRHLAQRSNIGLKITDKLAEPAEPLILRALANNDTAVISETTLDICLTASKDHLKLREALARRHDLSTEYATQLCIMLPENWREEMYRRFGIDKDTVEKLTVEAALGGTEESVEKEAARIVAERVESNTLTSRFALNALKTGKEAVFDHAVAHLCELTPAQWRVAVAMGGVRAAAMACQAVGFEKTDYPIIHRTLQKSGRMHQALEGEAMTAAANIFRMYGPEKAIKVLRQMGSRV